MGKNHVDIPDTTPVWYDTRPQGDQPGRSALVPRERRPVPLWLVAVGLIAAIVLTVALAP